MSPGRLVEVVADTRQPFPFHATACDMPFEIFPILLQSANDPTVTRRHERVLPHDEYLKIITADEILDDAFVG
jgi:hypothetical protein